ncbi:MAG: ISAzo13 family transposase [Gemmatimonadaceae bacterium]|nr:ISAzo13 family transposase [Gemmatimonadaceae bacterium]
MASRFPERETAVKGRYERIGPTLDERGRRLFAANEAVQFGFGGTEAVQRATGLSKSTIRRGIEDLEGLDPERTADRRQRRPGAGRKKADLKDPALLPALRSLLEPATRGDPESPLLWLSKSGAQTAAALTELGHPVSKSTALRLLKDEGFTLQAPKKVLEGTQHPDRNEQFEAINERVKVFQRDSQPVISVDTKKKELVGDYKNGGREWAPKGEGPKVLDHDFPNGVPKAVPYGVYDVTRNDGFVNVGVSGDTAEFAVATIGRWWTTMGKAAYPDATDLMITADCGGSNGYRVRLWRLLLQKLADETDLTITVMHLPPGTSKWNKIEHKMFSFISMNWRGRPLVSYEAIVNLIGNTRSKKGLAIRCEIDHAEYRKGRKVTDRELDAVHVERLDFHPEWNYVIFPTALAR